MIEYKTFTEICPDCDGSGWTTLGGTFKRHKCACKNGKVERIVGFDIPEDMTEPTTYLKKLTCRNEP